MARHIVVMPVVGRDERGGRTTSRATLADFGAFYERTYERAYRTALAVVGDSTLAADVVQDAYLAAYRGRARYRGDGPPEAWLIRIVVNGAISASRRRRIRWVQPLSPDTTASGDEPGRSVERLSMIAALQVLPPKERAAVVLRFYHDYDYATIARCLGTSPGTVGSWLSRAMDQLRIDLDRPSEHRPAEDRDGS